MDTIFALSSGLPPAGIGIVRVTGPQAGAALIALAGHLPRPRHAMRATFRNAAGDPLDDGLALFFPAPHSVTGEDVAEFHCHGGRAVVAAIEAAIGALPDCRRAEPGEFTRRAFANGRIDLAEAEGLADLLAAETELQRAAAMVMAGGALSRQVDGWRERLLVLSAQVEAALDFDDEDDVSALGDGFRTSLSSLADDIETALQAPHAEMLREGYRVALAGPPNAGKSTLFNALLEHDAAITAPIPGTTRDVLTQSVEIAGIPFTFVDMAGLRASTDDVIETIGIERAESEIERADLVLWLGDEGAGPAGAWELDAQCDLERPRKSAPRHRISAVSGEGMEALRKDLVEHAQKAMPKAGMVALHARQRFRLQEGLSAVLAARALVDPLMIGEELRVARAAFDALTGRTSTEDVLDTLFGRFCIGK